MPNVEGRASGISGGHSLVGALQISGSGGNPTQRSTTHCCGWGGSVGVSAGGVVSSLGGGAVWSGAGAGIVLGESVGAGAFAVSSVFEQPTSANISAAVSKEIHARIVVSSSCELTVVRRARDSEFRPRSVQIVDVSMTFGRSTWRAWSADAGNPAVLLGNRPAVPALFSTEGKRFARIGSAESDTR
jgi:hypothetical protein